MHKHKNVANGKALVDADRCLSDLHYSFYPHVAHGCRWDIKCGRNSGMWKKAIQREAVSALLGALFGLWAFMLAFTFSQSGTRFETVRSMIVDEGNILRNAIIRADFFPDSVRNGYRTDLRKYLEERIAYYDDDKM